MSADAPRWAREKGGDVSDSHSPVAGPVRPDTSVAHNARVWNYWIGGEDHYEVDRRVGEHVAGMFPVIRAVARADRGFLARAVRFLAAERGIRQFLDVGTGLPTGGNTHEVAQAVAPESRIVYVDNDPAVPAHARSLLTGTAEGATAFVDADARDPDTVVARAAGTLDLGRPVAVMMLGILNFVLDADEARDVVRRLMKECPPAASWCSATRPPTPTSAARATSRRWTSGTPTPPHRSPPAHAPRSPGSSTVWTWSSRGSCRARGGGPRPTRPWWCRSSARWP